MNKEKQIWIFSLVTLLGMIGLYIGGYYVYLKYQENKGKLDKLTSGGGVVDAVGALLSKG